MNETIETILNHRSVRAFKEKEIPDEIIHQIVEAAQAASTSSFLQAYSIIGVTDKEKKETLAELAGQQAYVAQNGHFFVFCADLYRLEKAADIQQKDVSKTVQSTEAFMIALIDAALAAQNAAIAAESLDLGICYIGGIRNHLKQVSELLEAPERVLPLFGMALGYPEKIEEKKPRLPREMIYHHNRYQSDQDAIHRGFHDYDHTVKDYYKSRTNGKRETTWTKQVSNTLEKSKRRYLNEYTKEKGFLQ